ncbi:MAG: nicotinate phosphoribosyltransferase, partial [Erysipelotrichaceae bacterium]|nr:nicotinate phosphoribosyltransferase [Erysipelotrichaceae bacterium]
VIKNYELEPLQKEIFRDGNCVYEQPDLKQKADYCLKQVNRLYPEVRRIVNPHEYYVDGSEKYIELKKKMIKEAGKRNV